jgi:hypothetical protein
MFSGPAARNILQSGHGTSEGSQPAGAFTLDEGFEGFTDQCSLFFYAGELLGGADEIVVEGNSGSQAVIPQHQL